MSRNITLIVIAAFAVFSSAVEIANAQSGSRGGGGSVARRSSGGGGGASFGGRSGSRSRGGLSAAERNAQLLLAQQQYLRQQQEAAEVQRKQFLQKLASNPNSSQNRKQLAQAFSEAKSEYMAIRKGQLPATGRKLTKIFVLRSKSLDRGTKEINWPKTFEQEPHADVVVEVEKAISENKGVAELGKLLQQLSKQLEQRAFDKSIAIKEYATAKRFVSGLAYEAEL